jgi:beta-galactosidase
VLVSSFKSFVANEYLTVYDDVQPHGLSDCFGMSYNQFTEPGRTTLRGKKLKYFMELLKPARAQVLEGYEHKYWGGYAAVTRNTYGAGKAYYVGCMAEKALLKEIYEKAAEDAGIRRDFEGLQWPLIVRSGENQEGQRLYYIMNYSEDEQRVICPYREMENVFSGAKYHLGDRIPIKDWDVVILEKKA